MKNNSIRLLFGAASLVALSSINSAQGDAVTDWSSIWEKVVFNSGEPVFSQPRSAAILHVAVFDAVNSIARKYTPYYVEAQAPPGAREEAAAIQAAYTVLERLYPAQAGVLAEDLRRTLEAIPGDQGKSHSILRGQEWGEYVANEILSLRSVDGWTTPPPPYFGGFGTGVWRSLPFAGNPDGTVAAVAAQVAYLTPFAMENPWQFRPGPPYKSTLAAALASEEYARDLNEVKAIGRVDSLVRTPDQTQLARLWQAMGIVDEIRGVRSVVPAHNKLVENARLFALIAIAGNDALIASMDSKFVYGLWRPHHAIRLADTDGNPATEADPGWTGLILAPRFPEYVANHACLSGGVMHAAARLLGDEHFFALSSPNYPGFSWSFDRFSNAGIQAGEARIWGGIHFRGSCELGHAMGKAVADYALETLMLPTP